MPLAAIESFTPLVNVPVDFDAFWNSTVDALRSVDADLQLDPQISPAAGMRHDKLSYRSFGDIQIAGYLLQHEDSTPRPLIVHSHGYNSQHDVMLNWAQQGCHVLGVDFRGFGRSQHMSLARGGYVLTGLDSPATSILRGAAMDLFRATELGQSLVADKLTTTTLYGFSFGGGMALMANAFGAPADLLVVGQPTFGWHSERLRLSTAGSSDEINRFLASSPSERATVMSSLAYFDSLHFASRIKTPTLIGIGLDDHVVPSRSVIAIANYMSEPCLEVRVLPVAHSDDPRESLWSVFDAEWLNHSVEGLPADFGETDRQVRKID